MADEVRIVVRADDQFSGVLGNFGSIITGIESAINLAGDALRFFGDMAMQGLDAIASYERMGASLETLVARELLMAGAAEDMTEALAMSSVQAEELLHWTQELAINSPFTAEGVNNAFRMAMAYGFTVEEAQRLTEAMIDFAAGSGASEAAMEAIARALGQISATGRVTGGDMLQLVNAGLPVVEILAEGFGVTTAELMKMREQGLLPATEAIEYITTYLETNFAGAAERQATTWAGLQGTFADIKTMGLREFFGGMFEVLQPLAVELSNFLQTEGMETLGDWGEKLGNITSALVVMTQAVINANGDFRILFTTFEDGSSYIGELLETLGMTEENADAWANAINQIFLNQDFSLFGEMLEEGMIEGIENIDWNSIGLQFNTAMQQEFDFSGGDDELSSAIGDAFTSLVAGAFGYMDWQSLAVDFREGVLYILHYGFDDLGRDLGLFDTLESVFSFGFDDIIRIIKQKLGISSPSTVFSNIARDMVLGLVGGWSSTIGNFISTIEDSISNIIDLFPDWLQDAIGLDASGLGTASGGTSGGTTGGSSGTQGGSGTVNNYFYGPVYIGSSLDDANYDCPSPNPLVGASGNQLVVTGY